MGERRGDATNQARPSDSLSFLSEPSVSLPDRFNAATYFVDKNVEEGRGDKVAIYNVSDGSTYSYHDLLAMANRTGNALKRLGLRVEERVMLLLRDCPEFAFSFFGAIKMGAVPIPTNTLLKPADYEYLLNDSRARILIVSEPLLDQIEPIRDRLVSLQHIVVVGQPRSGDQFPYHELAANASAELEAEEMSHDDACFWLYSSGTTGFPKGAVHLQHDMIYCADLYAKPILNLSEDDRTFSVAKLFFAYGLGNALYFPFRAGASTVLYPGKPDPVTIFNIIQEYRPTIFYSVPTAYAAMLAVPEAEKRFDTTSLRLCVSAGEALPPAIYHRWCERFGVEILDGIGSTEILHIFISNRSGRAKAGSSGEIVPGYKARIVDDEGNDLSRGEIGDLLINAEPDRLSNRDNP